MNTSASESNVLQKIKEAMAVERTLTHPEAYRLLALRAALKLEIKGMIRSRRPSAYAIIKQQFGLRGGRIKVLHQFEDALRKDGILSPAQHQQPIKRTNEPTTKPAR